MVKTAYYYFSFTHTLVVCLFYNRNIKRLEVLIRFLRFPECPFLLQGVERHVRRWPTIKTALLQHVCWAKSAGISRMKYERAPQN